MYVCLIIPLFDFCIALLEDYATAMKAVMSLDQGLANSSHFNSRIQILEHDENLKVLQYQWGRQVCELMKLDLASARCKVITQVAQSAPFF